MGDLLLRIMHALLARYSRKAWLYVDDLLAMLAKHSFVEQTCLLVCLLACVQAPRSWRKAQLGHSIVWCGWLYNLDFETVTLVPDKLAKLQLQLLDVARAKKVTRKTLEKLLGLLMWATTTCPQLRPYMAPLYKDLRSKRGTSLRSVHPNMWQHFLHALTPDGIIARSPAGLWLPLGGKVLEVAGHAVTDKTSIPLVPRARQETWDRVQDPTRHEIHLCQDSRVCLHWLHSCFGHARVVSLRQAPVLRCMAAADARADGDTVGVGGWISTSSDFCWFCANQWSMPEVRRHYPKLTKGAQAYIACFEMLAQLALAMMAKHRLTAERWKFCLPTASDNTSAEAGTNKLFTTTQPLCDFLQDVAAWSACSHVRLQVTHIAGEKNTWADELSRNKLQRFAQRSHQRHMFSLAQLAACTGRVQLHPPDANWQQVFLQASTYRRTYSYAKRPLPLHSSASWCILALPCKPDALAARYASNTPDAVRGEVS